MDDNGHDRGAVTLSLANAFEQVKLVHVIATLRIGIESQCSRSGTRKNEFLHESASIKSVDFGSRSLRLQTARTASDKRGAGQKVQNDRQALRPWPISSHLARYSTSPSRHSS
jgi:hypothetical protein